MALTFSPAKDAASGPYAASLPQVVRAKLVDDLETPVSAYLKIGHGKPYAFL